MSLYVVLDLARTSLSHGMDTWAYVAFPFEAATWLCVLALVIGMLYWIRSKILSFSAMAIMLAVNILFFIIACWALLYNIQDYAQCILHHSLLSGPIYGLNIMASLFVAIGLLMNIVFAILKLRFSKIVTSVILGGIILLVAGLSIKLMDSTYYPRCLAAARDGDKKLIVSCAETLNYHPISYVWFVQREAMFNKNTEFVKWSLDKGVGNSDPDVRAHAVNTCDELLPPAGADIYTKNAALLTAVSKVGCAEVVKKILDSGADANSKNNYGTSALDYAVFIKGNSETTKILLAAGADVNAKDKNGNTALVKAVRQGADIDIETIKALVAVGADVNIKDNKGETALMSHYVDPKVIKLLLTAGADVNMKDALGKTALMHIASVDSFLYNDESVKALLDADADVNAQDNEGKTALMHVVTENDDYNMQPLETLLSAGADVNIKDYKGRTALMLAVNYPYGERSIIETVKKLLIAGADVNTKDNEGKTALMKASARRFYTIVGLLKSAGAK